MDSQEEPIVGQVPTCTKCGGAVEDWPSDKATPGSAFDVMCPHCGGVAFRLLPDAVNPKTVAYHLDA